MADQKMYQPKCSSQKGARVFPIVTGDLSQHVRAPCSVMRLISLWYPFRTRMYRFFYRDLVEKWPSGAALSFISPLINRKSIAVGAPIHSRESELTDLKPCIRTDPLITRQGPPTTRSGLSANSSNSVDGQIFPPVAYSNCGLTCRSV